MSKCPHTIIFLTFISNSQIEMSTLKTKFENILDNELDGAFTKNRNKNKEYDDYKEENDYKHLGNLNNFVRIGENDYCFNVMEETYDSQNNILAPKNSIVFFNFIINDFAEVVRFSVLKKQHEQLETFAKFICEKYDFSYDIFITSSL